MVPQTLLALVLAGRALIPGDVALPGARQPDVQVQARYQPESREVSNWRFQAASTLEPKSVVALATLLKPERPFVTRCVKLNNYWCIKSARWNGELATDGEGHVGFVSADHGADAAATLLRRYYLEFKRKSALDIVRRWAPAECNVATGVGGIAVLAIRGIGGTVRARYLASHRRGKAVRYTAQAAGPAGKPGRVSMVIPLAPRTPLTPRTSLTPRTPQYRVPSIAAGMGEAAKPPRPPEPLVVARPKPGREPKATASVAPKPVPKPETAAACAPDEQRLRNYAARMVEGLDVGPTDDLRLFADDGTPMPNLAPVMLAMSAFELGMLRASPSLVERAIARATVKAQQSARADPT